MKKFLLLGIAFLQALVSLAGSAPAGSDIYTTDGYKATVLEDGTVAITWIYNEGEVTIPAEVTDNADPSTGTYKVSKVGVTWTLCENGKITKLVVSEGISTIGQSAFWGIASMNSLSLPSTLTHIESYAFGDCVGLTEISSAAKEAPVLGDDVFKTSGKEGKDWNYIGANCKLIIPDGSKSSYQGTETWTYWDTFAQVEELSSGESLLTAASGFSTYAASYPVNYKEQSLLAYAILLDKANMKVEYKEIDGVVPANVPVLVKGEPSTTYVLKKGDRDPVTVTTDLQVSDGTVVASGDMYYVFATVDGKSGFKRLENGLTIPAKKCYLKLSNANAKAFLELGDKLSTGINLEKVAMVAKDGQCYNLAGVRVSGKIKGVLVRNGKKFVNK